MQNNMKNQMFSNDINLDLTAKLKDTSYKFNQTVEYTASTDLSEEDLDRLMGFSTPTFARDPSEIAAYVEDRIVFYLKNQKYDEVLVMTGNSNIEVEDLEEFDLSEFRNQYNTACLNYNDALKLYPYFIETFGKDRFKVTKEGNIELKISYDEYTTKVSDQLERVNFQLRTESYIVNLVYNIRLKFEKKTAAFINKKINNDFNRKFSKAHLSNNIEFESECLEDANTTSEMYIDDMDELGGASIKMARKRQALLTHNKDSLAQKMVNRNYSFEKARSLLTNASFPERHKTEVLKAFQKHAAAKQSASNKQIVKRASITVDISKIEF